MELGQIEVPPEKLALLQITMSQARQSAQIKARTLASIVGRIISMGLAFGPISRFMTRSLYAVLESRCAWCEMLTLSSEAREELNFWSFAFSFFFFFIILLCIKKSNCRMSNTS